MSSSWGKTEKKKRKSRTHQDVEWEEKKKKKSREKQSKEKNLSKGSFVSLSSGRALCAVRAVISQLFS